MLDQRWTIATYRAEAARTPNFITDYAEAMITAHEKLRDLCAFITFDPASIRAAARASRNHNGPLAGVPLVVKDNVETAGMRTTGGTKGLDAWIPSTNATVLQKLIDAGAYVLGKANLHEYAFGSTSNNFAYGGVRNPYDPIMISGGSSGGTAAAIAAGLGFVGIGSDTAGSIRIPSSLCGTVGLKPTGGRYSLSGVVPLSATRDTLGFMTGSIEDIITLDHIAADQALGALPDIKKGTRLGVPRARFCENLDPGTAAVFESSLTLLRDNGFEIVDVTMPGLDELLEHGMVTVMYEVLRDLGHYLSKNKIPTTINEILAKVSGASEKILFDMASGPNSPTPAAYLHAQMIVRPQIQQLYRNAIEQSGGAALVFPSTPMPARPQGQDDTVDLNGQQVSTTFTYIRNTDAASNANAPVACVSGGLIAQGLPVGLSIEGAPGMDASVLAVARAFEKLRGPMPLPARHVSH
jgi:indoleacetamide hydrolase